MDLFEELREKFPLLVRAVQAPLEVVQNQVCIGLIGPDVGPLAEHLHSAY